MHPFAGVYTPLATPFTADGSLDERGLTANVERYLQTPLTGLVVLGSNGEAPQLDDDEADRAIAVVRAAMPRGRPLLAGTGRESTRATIAANRRAADLGADAVLVRTPAFYKGQMTTEAFVRHYTQVADRSPVPVLLYNVTIYTGVNLLPDAIAALSAHPNIVGIKETNSDMVQFGDYLSRAQEGFTVLAGSGATYYSALALGAHGAILAVGGVAPDLCMNIFTAVSDGRFAEARAMQHKLAPLARLVGTAHGVPGLKAALDLLGFVGGAPRPPLLPAGAAAIDAIREQLIALNLLEGTPAGH
ncbi:MAG: dihydrodipicolinate synthase family protein [Acidobacteria bacterium]|nr:dihydrodipicolinate synthase family protein [Acidobacteriota bacterium]MSO60479.1 dihydrodipicolinate synthase family protein [Acidobacteriota bacterium]